MKESFKIQANVSSIQFCKHLLVLTSLSSLPMSCPPPAARATVPTLAPGSLVSNHTGPLERTQLSPAVLPAAWNVRPTTGLANFHTSAFLHDFLGVAFPEPHLI